MSEQFKNIIVCDFEYEAAAGDLPNPLCMVAYVLDENCQHIDTIRLWHGEFGYEPPFDIGPDTLFVAYSAWAEMTCFKVLGWKFPKYIFDQHTAYLAASNILLPYDPDEVRRKPRKRLSDACRMYGIEGWEGINKGDISAAIGDGTWRDQYSEQYVFAYCEEDGRMGARLLRAQLRGTDHFEPANVPLVIHWSEYSAKAIALIQARGMPIDMAMWNIVQENKAAVIAELIRRFDPSHNSPFPIFSEEGEWSYQRFGEYLVYAGVPAWSRLDSGQLDVSSDAFRLMYNIPGIEGLHALRDSLGFIAKARLPNDKRPRWHTRCNRIADEIRALVPPFSGSGLKWALSKVRPRTCDVVGGLQSRTPSRRSARCRKGRGGVVVDKLRARHRAIGRPEVQISGVEVSPWGRERCTSTRRWLRKSGGTSRSAPSRRSPLPRRVASSSAMPSRQRRTSARRIDMQRRCGRS